MGDHVERDGLAVGVTRHAAHFSVVAPLGPRSQQESLFIRGADLVLKRHLIDQGRRGRRVLQVAFQSLAALFVCELEPLNQAGAVRFSAIAASSRAPWYRLDDPPIRARG